MRDRDDARRILASIEAFPDLYEVDKDTVRVLQRMAADGELVLPGRWEDGDIVRVERTGEMICVSKPRYFLGSDMTVVDAARGIGTRLPEEIIDGDVFIASGNVKRPL